MDLLKLLQQELTITNTKGGKYYATTYNSNLDFFTTSKRYMADDEIKALFNAAFSENKEIAVANLLYTLDIRGGKGERKEFKLCFKELCGLDKEMAIVVLHLIGDLGRFDYVLVGLGTQIEGEVVDLIKKQLESDLNSEHVSLLAKWLPTLRTHNKNNVLAKRLVKLLGMSEKDYRKTLALLRSKINIIEKNLTERQYDKINFEEVPSKAMLKYTNSFNENMGEKYIKYLVDLKNGKAEVKTSGLFAYEIIKAVCSADETKIALADEMWKNQKDLIGDNDANILVVADTSASMTWDDMIPFSTAIGLAIYFAERNKGMFKDHFITFSSRPILQRLIGNTLHEKVENIEKIAENTDIDEVFRLLLETAIKNKLPQKDMPEQLIIISDMEFDYGVYSNGGTNFHGWKQAFAEFNYDLPKIVFWNVAGASLGVPATIHDDVIMVSGFSTNIFENILNVEEFSPVPFMCQTLQKYIDIYEETKKQLFL